MSGYTVSGDRIMRLFFSRNPHSKYAYDPDKEKPVIHASVCTGEQVAGFKDWVTGSFHEVMLIRDEKDLKSFMKAYGLDHVDTEY